MTHSIYDTTGTEVPNQPHRFRELPRRILGAIGRIGAKPDELLTMGQHEDVRQGVWRVIGAGAAALALLAAVEVPKMLEGDSFDHAKINGHSLTIDQEVIIADMIKAGVPKQEAVELAGWQELRIESSPVYADEIQRGDTSKEAVQAFNG